MYRVNLLIPLFIFTFVSSCANVTEQLHEQEKRERLKCARDPFTLRVMTYNVCNTPEIYKDPKIKETFSWASRKERIFKQILEESPDIIGFQEIRNEPEGSVLSDLWAGLGAHGYEFVTFRNNPHEFALLNTIAYKAKKVSLDKTNRWWASETPDQFSDSWGNGWGRVALMASFYPITTKNVRGQNIPSPDYDQPPIHVVNVHHGLKHTERMNSNRVLVEKVDELVGKKLGMVVITGDFNSFPDDGGQQELNVLKDAGYQEVFELKTSDGIAVSGSFIGYSFDKFRSPKEKLGSQVDHVFVKMLSKNCVYTSKSHVNVKKYDGSDNEVKAKSEAELLIDCEGKELRDSFCSDHLPGIVDIEVVCSK
jgi:endonuclease/exonuclease/phosphatase family metal-dependent hydrolase